MSKSLDPQPQAFACTAEQLAIRDEARRYCMAEFHPLEQRMDEEAWWPADIEVYQIVTRHTYRDEPSRAEYHLTPVGQALEPVIASPPSRVCFVPASYGQTDF